MEPLAHSARHGCPEQSYQEHVGNVLADARSYAQAAAGYARTHGASLLAAVEMAAAYHDLGKLDALFQDDLRKNRPRTRINHVDAGVATMLQPNVKQGEAALLVYSHHRGLADFAEEKAKNANGIEGMFRDWTDNEHLGSTVREHVDAHLSGYLAQHHSMMPPAQKSTKPGFSGLMRRIALSCLVDADHGDTARHYGKEFPVHGPALRAEERLVALDRYVAGLAQPAADMTEKQKARQAMRAALYLACRNRKLRPEDCLVACESPVGTGKTTAVMAHLLATAVERGLRRVIVVLPFTNIIDQSVEIYRNALVLLGENPEEIVAAHHHRVEFTGEEAMSLRLLTQRWEAPIIVTTAVQFFGTLAAANTASLRKLHRLVGSCIFVDETHAAMPAPLWPQMFRWLAELGREWSCHTVFASGSLARFWTMPEFFPDGSPGEVVELVASAELMAEAKELEQQRVTLETLPQPLSKAEIADALLASKGPRLIIFNTVQSAAVFADYMTTDRGISVEHLSTALTPHDRESTVRRVRRRLRDVDDTRWCLVATSCVEAGVDFSFRTAFRESCGLVNLIQIAGRVNRHEEHSAEDPKVWDFRHDGLSLLSVHPQFKLSRSVLAGMFSDGLVAPTSEACSEALRRELSCDYGEGEERATAVRLAEKQGKYPEVARLCRLINQDTRTVVVCLKLAEELESLHPSQYPPMKDIMKHSVQLWASRLESAKWPVKPICGSDELWAWVGEYSPFLGYMAGVLPLLKAGQQGFDTF